MSKWTPVRAARLGYLAGLGYSAREIANDPIVDSTETNIGRHASRFKVSLKEGRQRPVPEVTLTKAFRDAARTRDLRVDELIHKVIAAVAAEPNLIDAILDDRQ
jgi:hypothetical protein